MIKPSQIDELASAIAEWQGTLSEKQIDSHVANLQKRHSAVHEGDNPLCPYCGGEMVLRKRRGDGKSFYGCKTYPKCRGIYVSNTDDTSVTGDKAYSLYPMVRLQDTITATAANTTALGGLKLVKLSQSEYDSLATKDDNTVYFIGDSNGYTMKIGNVNVN